MTAVGAAVSGLTSGQIYSFRTKASSAGGTNYGLVMTFTTTLKDYDRNINTTVTIVTQFWMNENLKITKSINGAAIPLASDNAECINLSTPVYSWCNLILLDIKIFMVHYITVTLLIHCALRPD